MKHTGNVWVTAVSLCVCVCSRACVYAHMLYVCSCMTVYATLLPLDLVTSVL